MPYLRCRRYPYLLALPCWLFYHSKGASPSPFLFLRNFPVTFWLRLQPHASCASAYPSSWLVTCHESNISGEVPITPSRTILIRWKIISSACSSVKATLLELLECIEISVSSRHTLSSSCLLLAAIRCCPSAHRHWSASRVGVFQQCLGPKFFNRLAQGLPQR